MLTLAAIDNHSVVWQTDPSGITVNGHIDEHSLVFLETPGDITITGKIDGGSQVTLKAGGNVSIGSDTTLSSDDRKIDGKSSVTVSAGGSITFGSYIHKATADLRANGSITVPGEINYGARIRNIADGIITYGDKIDGSSRLDAVSNRSSITINKKITGGSKVWLTASGNVSIGQTGSDDDKKIDSDSFVAATSGGQIDLGGAVDNSHTCVDFAACGTVTLHKTIQGGATVRLMSAAGKITVADGISDSGTHVTSFPTGALSTKLNNDAPAPVQTDWTFGDPLCLATPKAGSWWQNWSQTFGYVVPDRRVPRSLDDLAKAVVGAPIGREPDKTPVKAVGGGWSFTDASLPLLQPDVEAISIFNKGRRGMQGMRNLLESLSAAAATPMDLLPDAVAQNQNFSTRYNQSLLRQITNGGAQLSTPASNARIIDTRNLASSLQCDFPGIQTSVTGSDPAGRPLPQDILFHVEAGITIADLQQLLDHQSPRLALRATGGSPGATLAGTLSSATHGGEFSSPLLVDEVRAIHLVGPGGVQWWIEGDIPVADPVKLQARYPAIDAAHFIGGPLSPTPWSGISGLSAQDVLKAVVVSMGTMGVIYSVVLHVVQQFGIRQVVTSLTWDALLAKAGVTRAQLTSADPKANTQVLMALLQGDVNGTGILQNENVYADLAINPINLDCWIVNREQTPALPDDPNTPGTSLNDFMETLAFELGKSDDVNGDKLMGRVFDVFHYPTNIVNFASDAFGNFWNGGPETTSNVTNLLGLVTSLSSAQVGALAALCAQVAANMHNDSNPDNGLDFFGGVLTGIFHAMQGTRRGRNAASGLNSDTTAVSYTVGAIGWPDTGIPGRGFEIALDPTNAFTFLQKAIIDDVLANTMRNGKNPLLGYISVRVCPPTQTLLGMQQYSPWSVMTEIVAYRSPEANAVMDAILDRVLAFKGPGPLPLLHWGLENDRFQASNLVASPLGQPFRGAMTRLDAFRAIRNFLRGGHPPVFDNAFTARMGL